MPLDRGVYYPVITPFDGDERVDHETFEALIDFGIERGVDGVFALGTAGQGPVMSHEERTAALETAVDAVDGRVPLIGHVGHIDVEKTVPLVEHANDLHLDMIALLPPYYYSDHTYYTVERHFEQVAEHTDKDLLLYNNPPYVGYDVTPDQLEKLTAAVPSLRGIKASFVDVDRMIEYVDVTPEGFRAFTGSIENLFPGAYYGVHGAINPPTSVFPEVAVEFWEAVANRDVDRAAELKRMTSELTAISGKYGDEYGRGAYQGFFELRGVNIERYPKWDTKPISDEALGEMRADFEAAGLEEYV